MDSKARLEKCMLLCKILRCLPQTTKRNYSYTSHFLPQLFICGLRLCIVPARVRVKPRLRKQRLKNSDRKTATHSQ